MSSTIAAIAVVVLLSAWHLHNRRHAGWSVSADGRFYIGLSYPLVAIAAYWLVTAPAVTDWEWALGNGVALVAVLSCVAGFGALNRVTAEHARFAVQLETIEPAAGAINH